VHAGHARSCKAIAYARLKNDRVHAGHWRTCCARTCCPRPDRAPAGEELRMVCATAHRGCHQRTLLKSRVRAVLADRGIDAPA